MPRPTIHRAALGVTVALLVTVGGASPASAQWTLPQGQVFVSTGFDFQYADSEFLGERGFRSERAFPLNGEYVGGAVNLSARAGVTDALELELAMPLRVVAFTGDPVLLVPQPDGSSESALDYYQRNVINLSQSNAGLGDIQVAARYRMLPSPFPLTAELRLKIPGGYAGPEGTFGARPTSAQAILDDFAGVVRPENVSDDVTLGDAQVDLVARLLGGAAFDTGTFIAGDVGYNARFDDAGHQVLASLRAGQLFENVLLLFAGASFGISVTEARLIGISVAAQDPLLPAAEYGGATNLLLREVRFARDFLDLYAGVIVRLTPEIELKAAYSRTVWGRNTAAVNTFSLGFGGRTALFETAANARATSDEGDEDDYEEDARYEPEALEAAPPEGVSYDAPED